MDRWYPEASIHVGDAIYGTRRTNPSAGCVFRMEKDGSGYTALHIFGGKRGYGPDGLLLADGVLYGVTTWGGPDYRRTANGSSRGHGILYRLNLDGSGFKVLHAFRGPDGSQPQGTPVMHAGMLYGVTQAGGRHGAGVLFRMPAAGGWIEALLDFDDADAAYPNPLRPRGGDVLMPLTRLSQGDEDARPHLS
jgi:uncharacterized repeat protein (TIGR03803 family)